MSSPITEKDLYECCGCNQMIDYQMRDDKSGICIRCLHCGDCGCECEDEEMDDCECGYTHHNEDKCPNQATAKHYIKWRKDEDDEEDEEEDEDNDNGRECERCLKTSCPSDDVWPCRLLWNSNKTGKEICRCCVAAEDEENS